MSILDKLLGWLLAPLALFRSLVFFHLRLRGKHAAAVYKSIQDGGRYWAMVEELSDDPVPKVFSAACFWKSMPLIFLIQERMLQAGYSGYDTVISVYGLRWQKAKLIAETWKSLVVENNVPVYIAQEWDAEKIGELKVPTELPTPYWENELFADIDSDTEMLLCGDKDHLGIILYGPPGNGKTYFVRYLALKYRLPIYVVSFTPEMTNHSLIRMFGHVRGPGIVLLEDFDNYFEGRSCKMENAKFTFDTLLNVIDGVFCTPKNLIFIMTANDIAKIDMALKSRPSRFKHIRCVLPPTIPIIRKIFPLGDINNLLGRSLDDLLALRAARSVPDKGTQ